MLFAATHAAKSWLAALRLCLTLRAAALTSSALLVLFLFGAPLLCVLHCSLVGTFASHSAHHQHLAPASAFLCDAPASAPEHSGPLLPPALLPLVPLFSALLAPRLWQNRRWRRWLPLYPFQVSSSPPERPPMLLPC